MEKKFFFETDGSILWIKFPKYTTLTPDIIKELYWEEFEFLQKRALNDLWDMRDCLISSCLDNNFILDMMDEINKNHLTTMKHFKTAFLVNTDLGLGMARMFQLMGDGLPFRVGVFREEDKAKTWLTDDNQGLPQA